MVPATAIPARFAPDPCRTRQTGSRGRAAAGAPIATRVHVVLLDGDSDPLTRGAGVGGGGRQEVSATVSQLFIQKHRVASVKEAREGEESWWGGGEFNRMEFTSIYWFPFIVFA